MDLFYNRLKRDIEDFYYNTFMEADATQMHHLSLLKSQYDPTRFQNCANLNQERIVFLTELQGMVEGRSYWGE